MFHTEKFYKRVFLAAAAYNFFWGIIIVILPNLIFQIFDLPPMNYPFLMSGIGMFVGVYGYGYWIVSREPVKYPQLVIVGLLGKTLGPIGWAYHVYLGDIPLETMWVNVFNDLIWIPFFIAYLRWQKNEISSTNKLLKTQSVN
jgi:small multidrug resistance pump